MRINEENKKNQRIGRNNENQRISKKKQGESTKSNEEIMRINE